jgi:hypothetical protein
MAGRLASRSMPECHLLWAVSMLLTHPCAVNCRGMAGRSSLSWRRRLNVRIAIGCWCPNRRRHLDHEARKAHKCQGIRGIGSALVRPRPSLPRDVGPDTKFVHRSPSSSAGCGVRSVVRLALDRRSETEGRLPTPQGRGHPDEGRQASRRTPTLWVWQSWRSSDRRHHVSGARPNPTSCRPHPNRSVPSSGPPSAVWRGALLTFRHRAPAFPEA